MWHARIWGIFLALCIVGTGLHAEAKDKSGVLKASDLIGMKVEGADGKKLGDIKDMVVDPEDGSIEYVVLDFGGLVGIGDKYFAVPWEAVELSSNNKKLLIGATKKDLKDAPGFDKNQWPDLSDQDQVTTIYEFYEVPIPSATTSTASPKGDRKSH